MHQGTIITNSNLDIQGNKKQYIPIKPCSFSGCCISFIALNQSIQTLVFLKIFAKHQSLEQNQETFQKEIQALNQVSKLISLWWKDFDMQNIQQINDFNGLSNDFGETVQLEICAGYIEMELADYGDLQELSCLYNSPLPEKAVKHIMRPVLEELDKLHEKGFSHRDLRPENILIQRNLVSCLTDFGYTVYTQQGLALKDCEFCYNYAPPELLFDDIDLEPYYDAFKADIYSLGKTLLALISQNGFIDRTSRQYSRTLFQLIKQLLHENPDKRPSTKELLKHPFFNEDIPSKDEFQKIMNDLLEKAWIYSDQRVNNILNNNSESSNELELKSKEDYLCNDLPEN